MPGVQMSYVTGSLAGLYSFAGLYVSGVIVLFVLSIVIGIVQRFRGKDLLDLPDFIAGPLTWGWLIAVLSGVVTIMAAFIKH
jgi:hypothetical protein